MSQLFTTKRCCACKNAACDDLRAATLTYADGNHAWGNGTEGLKRITKNPQTVEERVLRHVITKQFEITDNNQDFMLSYSHFDEHNAPVGKRSLVFASESDAIVADASSYPNAIRHASPDNCLGRSEDEIRIHGGKYIKAPVTTIDEVQARVEEMKAAWDLRNRVEEMTAEWDLQNENSDISVHKGSVSASVLKAAKKAAGKTTGAEAEAVIVAAIKGKSAAQSKGKLAAQSKDKAAARSKAKAAAQTKARPQSKSKATAPGKAPAKAKEAPKSKAKASVKAKAPVKSAAAKSNAKAPAKTKAKA